MNVKRITPAEYTGGFVYVDDGPGTSYGEGYFCSVDHLVEVYADEEFLELPEEVMGCRQKTFRIDAQRLIDDALEYEEWFEGAEVPAAKVEELQALLDTWAERAVPPCNEPDPSTIIVLGDKERARYARLRGEAVR